MIDASTPIRLLLVDDHTLFRRGLSALLTRDAGMRIVGDAADADEALRKAVEFQPDVILLDNHLPGVRGVDAIGQLRQAAPRAAVVLLTVSEDPDDLAAALRAGASGYLLKTMDGDELSASIRRVLEGDSVIAPQMTAKLVEALRRLDPHKADTPARTGPASALATLSPREQETLSGIARGASNKEIARELGIAETTVKIHVQNLMRKLGVNSRVQAAVMASQFGPP